MKDDCILATGVGNPTWNFSAPHGAGRELKRSEARQLISLSEYKATMVGVYSSCINPGTIDESPLAYKSSKKILSLIKDTVETCFIMQPIYNFKAGSN